MLTAVPPDNSSPLDRLMASLFNRVHSTDAFMAGIRLAVVLPERVAVKDVPGGEVQIFVLRGNTKFEEHRTSSHEFLLIAPKLSRAEVLLARWGLKPDVERQLERLGWKREIAGQVTGFWFNSHSDIPTEMPGTVPTGAVIPPQGHRLGDGAPCLDLVLVDYQWLPLSEAGLDSYGHSSELVRGASMIFVPLRTRVTPWPTLFTAKLAKSVSCDQVARLYGKEAAERARPDFSSVRVKLSRAKRQ
jgi:hypothetical protein